MELCVSDPAHERPLRFCRQAGCREKTRNTGGFCETHKERNQRGEYYKTRDRLNPLRKEYLTPRYRAFRARVDKYNPACQRIIDGEQCCRAPEILHHIVPPEINFARFLDPTNVVMVCRKHHPDTPGEPDCRPGVLAKLYVPTVWPSF